MRFVVKPHFVLQKCYENLQKTLQIFKILLQYE